MPELPEVEAARRAIEEHCVGKRIVKAVVADDPKVIDGVSPSDFESSLTGKIIVAALRKGKNLWLRLDSPPFPSFQFGMAGAIYIKGVVVVKYKRSAVSSTDEWPSKYSKVFMELDDGLELSFTDKRRFAKVRLLQDPASVPPISELGPDALLEIMQMDEFVNSICKKKTGIKALLLDQSYISGIGNWIADEVLYQAKIHPLQTAANLSKESCELLHRCIKEVLEKALEVGADSSQFPNNWIFHSREKKPGKAFVDGKRIEFITAGGRTSAFVPELQKLTGSQSQKASAILTKTKSGRNVDDKKESSSEEDEEEEVEDEESDGQENKNKRMSKPKEARGAHEIQRGRGRTKKKEEPTKKEVSEKDEPSKKRLKNSKGTQQKKKTRK